MVLMVLLVVIVPLFAMVPLVVMISMLKGKYNCVKTFSGDPCELHGMKFKKVGNM